MIDGRVSFGIWLTEQPAHWRQHLQTDALLAWARQLLQRARMLGMGVEDITTADDDFPRTRSKLPRGWARSTDRKAIVDVLDSLDAAASAVAMTLRWEWFSGTDPWDEAIDYGPQMSVRRAMHDGEPVLLAESYFDVRVHPRTLEQQQRDSAIGDN